MDLGQLIWVGWVCLGVILIIIFYVKILKMSHHLTLSHADN
jgi:hypothetical protein